MLFRARSYFAKGLPVWFPIGTMVISLGVVVPEWNPIHPGTEVAPHEVTPEHPHAPTHSVI